MPHREIGAVPSKRKRCASRASCPAAPRSSLQSAPATVSSASRTSATFQPPRARCPSLTSSLLPPELQTGLGTPAHDAGRAGRIDRHVRASVHAGSSLYALDDVLLASLAPDVIITQELCAVCAVSYEIVARAARRIAGPGPAVVSLEPSSLEDVYANIDTVGDLAEAGPGARALVAALRKREAALRAAPPGRAATRTGAGVERSADERRPLDARLGRTRRRRTRVGQPRCKLAAHRVGGRRGGRSRRYHRRALRLRSGHARAPRRRGWAVFRLGANCAPFDRAARTRWTATRTSTAPVRGCSTAPRFLRPPSPVPRRRPGRSKRSRYFEFAVPSKRCIDSLMMRRASFASAHGPVVVSLPSSALYVSKKC